MELNEARDLLNDCTRDEFRDHAFGDVEITWFRGGFKVAEGYFGGTEASIGMVGNGVFSGSDAFFLKNCGKEGNVERNDTTGPDDFVIGRTMPGLTKEGVKEELTSPVQHNIFKDSNGLDSNS